MNSTTWRKRFSIISNRLYLYPTPEPLPRKRQFWIALLLVTGAVILFCAYFIVYLTTRHEALLTSAEDLGIMDQAVWNTLHGNMLHQTICNVLSDVNCYGSNGITRFAIHFEPILFPISLLYLIWSDPRMLLTLQTVVVATGAFPAFLLARLRLRNELAAAGIALLYLFYPAQQQATVYDFHAVTFTAALLLFTLYFMYTRRTVLLFVFAVLAMACKEEIPLVIVMFGLWSMLFQRRWRTGSALVLLGGAWFALAVLIIMPHFSPTGQPMLIGRYGNLGKGPVQIVAGIVLHPMAFLHQYVLERNHLFYLRVLLTPAGYLPVLAPWVLVLALPSLAINMLGSDVQMYSGLYQYNAEIAPVLIFATIEAIVLILWLVQFVVARLPARGQEESSEVAVAAPASSRWSRGRFLHAGLLALMVCWTLFNVVRADVSFHGQLPFSSGFQWPVVSSHDTLAQRFIAMIPPTASVSAQTELVPHLSQRETVYQFPYGDGIATPSIAADYIFLDVTGNIYPFFAFPTYTLEVKKLLFGGNYGVVAAQDGYLLLKRGGPSPGLSPISVVQPGNDFNTIRALPNLPASFCSNIYVSPKEIQHPLQVTFMAPGGDLKLLGADVGAPSKFSRTAGYMSVTTYWQVTAPITSAFQILFLANGSDGKEYMMTTDVPALFWCETNTWKPGAVIRLTSGVFGLQRSHIPNGLVHISMALVPLTQPSSKIMDVTARLPLRVMRVPDSVSPTQGTNALQLKPIKLTP